MHVHGADVIRTGDDHAVPLNVVRELHKRAPETGRRRITVRVVPLHVRDHRHLRGCSPRNMWSYSSASSTNSAAAAGRRIAIDRDVRTDDIAALDPGLPQHLHDHGRGRRLAMRARHGDQPAVGQQDRQKLAALDDRQAQLLGRLALGIGGVHGAADKHDVGQFLRLPGRSSWRSPAVPRRAPLGLPGAPAWGPPGGRCR